ncbi:MAG TPA: hypothetical protein VFL66_05560 [Gaiellaceae bacterium]|nr:hypothetical protein [Gaiellaceae bacterium]
MATPSLGYRIRRLVGRAGEEVQEKAWTVGRDPAEERRVRLAWGALEGVLGAVFTLAARRLATRIWFVLTGEPVPGRSK